MIEARLRCLIVSALICVLSFASQAAWSADSKHVPKRVMLLYYSFGSNSVNAKAIRAALERGSGELLEIYEATFARAADENAMDRYAEYLGSVFPDKKLDLVVTVGAPALILFQRNRQRLFPSAKLLATAEARRIPAANMTPNDVILASKIDLAAIVRNIMQVLPETTNLEVVVGNSPSERDWFEQVRVAFEPFQDRASLRSTNDLSFEEMLTHVATLPPRSAILFLLFLIDFAGQTHEDTKVLARLQQAANAPIFSFYDGGFGNGIVGGPLISVQERSQTVADASFRILRGEAPSDIKLPDIGASTPKFDWREMQRWNIAESRLPPGSEIHFRTPGMWDQYRWQITGTLGVLMFQSALIMWLFIEHRRRRDAEEASRSAMGRLAHMNRVATAGELSASIAHEVNQPLTQIVANASAALHWLANPVPNLDEVRASLNKVVSGGHRAADVLGSVRKMFKTDNEEKTPLDLNDLVREVLGLMRAELQAQGITIHTGLTQPLPLILGHSGQLQQVILNLVRNAADAMKSAPGRERILRMDSAIDPDGVLVSIEDSGTGIDPKDMDRIFDSFFTTKPQGMGMGMGLSICRSIIKAHGGRLSASSTGLSHGSVFQIVLPVGGPGA